eukprot:4990036-Prymnesium_polylepis.1
MGGRRRGCVVVRTRVSRSGPDPAAGRRILPLRHLYLNGDFLCLCVRGCSARQSVSVSILLACIPCAALVCPIRWSGDRRVGLS